MAIHIGRRNLIVMLASAAAARPFTARAQQDERRIGLLMNGVPTEPTYRSWADTFVKTLQTLGWRDGQNLRLDIRWSASDPKLIRYYAEELVATAPDLIVVASTANLQALLQATNSRFRSCSWGSPILLSRALFPILVILAATSQDLSPTSFPWAASGSTCLSRWRQASPGSRSCSTRTRHRNLRCSCALSRRPR